MRSPRCKRCFGTVVLYMSYSQTEFFGITGACWALTCPSRTLQVYHTAANYAAPAHQSCSLRPRLGCRMGPCSASVR